LRIESPDLWKKIRLFKYSLAQKRIFHKGEWQSLVLYVKEPVKWPPVDEMSWDFACREQMGLRLQGKKIGS